MYFMPFRTDASDFSKSRVNPLLADNPFLMRLVQDTDTVGLKRIGDAHLYLRGMQSTVGMKSVPADMLVFDELDEASPGAKTMAMERLAHSDYKRVIELSNPSLPDYGIDEQFQKSDQRHWTLRCEACGTWTALDKAFPQKLGEDVKILLPRPDGSVYRACPKCAHELDTERGEWVADFPDRRIRGYRISQLFSSKVDPAEILTEYRTTRFPDRFYNLKVGIPWADLSRRVDESSVLALCGSRPMSQKDPNGYVTMGVDTGKHLHVVVLQSDRSTEISRVLHLEACHEFSQLEAIAKAYGVDRCVIDGLPETHATREFVTQTSCRAFMCFFSEQQRGGARWDDGNHHVAINRTEALDASRAAIRDRLVELPRRSPIVEEFAKHMAADAKVLDEDEETGVRKFRYVRTGADHFSMAFTYAWMAGAEKHAVVTFAIRRGF
jgi:hypothetical protein